MIPRTPARELGYIINSELESCGINIQLPVVYGDNEDDYTQKYVKCSNPSGNALYVLLDDSVYVDSENLVCFRLSDAKSQASELSLNLIKLFHRDISGLVVEVSDTEGLTDIEIYTIGNNGNTVCTDIYKQKDQSGDLEAHYPLFRLSEILANPGEVNDGVDRYWLYLNDKLGHYAVTGIDTIITDLESTVFSLKAIKKFLLSKMKGEPDVGSDPIDIYFHNENLLEIFKQIASLSTLSQEIKDRRALCRSTESKVEQFYKNE